MKISMLIALIILSAFIVIAGPFVLIWSINTLFPVLAIEYTLDTWLAVIIVLIFLKDVHGPKYNSK
jgi:hypothetical protein